MNTNPTNPAAPKPADAQESNRSPEPPRRLKILHLEDSPVDAELVQEILRSEHVDCDIIVVAEKEDFDRELAKGDVDVIISDYNLPRFSGTDALRQIRKTEKDLPFIFVSGSIGEERAVEVVGLGATDYVMKEHLRRLGIAVRRSVEAANSVRRQREAENRLAEERDFLADVFSSVQDGIVVLDADLKIVNTNPTMETWFPGLVPFAGKSADQLCPGDGGLGVSTLRDGQPVKTICKMETAKGSGEFSIYAYPLVERRTGHQRGVILYLRDITSERALQQQLFQAQKMESIGQLAGGVAHDFNNILQAIMGFAEILDSEIPADDPKHEDVLEIRKATDRAVALTRQLLAFSRKQVLSASDLDLNELVGNMGGMLKRLIPATVQLRFDVDSAPAPVRGDAGLIEQIVMNLVVNARDAMPQGGQVVVATRSRTVTAREASAKGGSWKAGRYVCLSVQDTGTGIPPEVLTRLFEPFFTTKEKGKGTGLGLSTVYGISQQHGGWVDVASEAGHGTTFTVYLPASGAAPARGL